MQIERLGKALAFGVAWEPPITADLPGQFSVDVVGEKPLGEAAEEIASEGAELLTHCERTLG